MATAPAASTHPRRAVAAAALRSADAVCFDVDSTVVTVEGIDEFAAFAGKKAEVAALTAAAMGGSVKFQDALAARLGIIQPTTSLLARFLAEHPFAFTPGVRDFIAALRGRGTAVFLVSGGFTQMIHPVADSLGIPRGDVYANTILFDGCGCVAGRGVGPAAASLRTKDCPLVAVWALPPCASAAGAGARPLLLFCVPPSLP
jgi:phosphoserine phosphatase